MAAKPVKKFPELRRSGSSVNAQSGTITLQDGGIYPTACFDCETDSQGFSSHLLINIRPGGAMHAV